MALWFETKIKFNKIVEDGSLKTVTETHLVDALSFTEAEARIIKEMEPYISGEFNVTAVKKTNISEIFYDKTDGKWYNVKADFITIDEKTGLEKKSPTYFLVQAIDFVNAYENFMHGMKGTLSDFDIASISETKILDVYEVENE